MMKKFAVVIPAAGRSTRMGGRKKENIVIGDMTVLDHVRKAFESFDRIVVVGPGGDVPGGERRQDSVMNGLAALGDEYEFVLVHDGARPFVSADVIERVRDALLSGSDAVIPCVRPKDTIRTADRTLDRSSLYAVQTPQGFKLDVLRRCYEIVKEDGVDVTDDASAVEYCGYKVDIVEGDYANLKITTPEDLPSENRVRFGTGYDLHKLVEGRTLWLGCVEIPFEKGLLGHSDADIIAHAIADAMLGAAALGDIGKHFPDTAAETEGMSGERILSETAEILKKNGFEVKSVDATLIAQRPKISPYTDKMRAAIAKALGIDISKVSVKATTEEGMGPTGEGLAMAAYAAATVEEL
ncbi:MAG: 2-C-methyl-D-erythritol 2,4-cyclodiphosphate synthase [Firmicutes bacterium]|nr:2-C-methyl-D-erythritol 2,4-cyclodiphosphate synthase [Bacillota bacterium]